MNKYNKRVKDHVSIITKFEKTRVDKIRSINNT